MKFSTIERTHTDIKIAYETVGTKEAKPFLFLHGLGASKVQTTKSLTDLNHHLVIAPDMLGHGDSISSDRNCELSFNQFADDSITILDDMGIEKADIGGLSMGSGICINIALRYPQRVKKLVLLRPCWLNEKEPLHLQLVALVGKWIEEFGADKARSLLHDHAVYKELVERLPKVALSIDGLFSRPHVYSHTAVLYRMWQDAPFFDLSALSEIENESLVLHTTRDELHPVSVATTVAQHLPNCQIQSLPPRYDKPTEYGIELNRSIADFLSDN